MRKDCSGGTPLFRSKIMFMLTILLSGSLLSGRIGLAQSSTGPGVDLIILIDQSGSMSYGVQPRDKTQPRLPPTDPGERRVYTAQYLIDYMAFDNLYVNPSRTNRVLVIGFGSPNDTYVMVPLASLKTEEDAEKAKGLVKAEYLGETSFLSAFRLIRQEFPPSTDAELTSGLRRRLVIVITDGGPYEGGSVDFEEYYARLGDFYESELGAEHYPTYVIGIDKNDIYWSRVEHLWEDNVTGEGNAVRVDTIDEINKNIVEMICPFLNPTGTGEECRLQELGDHFIPPYAQTVSFSFFKYDPDAQTTLYRPTLSGETGGKEVVPTKDQDVLQYKTTPRDQFYVMGAPTPGCWRSERRGTGKVDVFTQIVFNDMLMTKPTSAHPMVAPLEFEFSLKDVSGSPIDEWDDFPLDLNAELTGPDGSTQAVTIEQVQPGLYASKQGALPTVTGTYTLTMEGTTTIPYLEDCHPSRETHLVFSQAFQMPVYEPGVVVNAPMSPYYHYRPLEGLSVQFTDEDGSPLTTAVDSRLSAELMLESPAGETQTISGVKPDGNGFRSDEPIPLPASGTYTVAVLLRAPSGNQTYEGYTTFEVTDAVEVIRPGPIYPALAPLRFVEVVLRDEARQPLETDPQYPLRLEAKMIWPDGISETIALATTTSPGSYRVSADWSLEEVAPHTLEIIGYTSLQAGLPEEPVFISRQSVNVSVLPFFRVVIPDEQQPGREYPLHYWFLPPLPSDFTYQPQPVQVELRYGNLPGKAKDFFTGGSDDLFHLMLVDPTGEIVADQVPLSASGDEEALFSIDIPGLKSAGAYTATISLVGQVRPGVEAQGAWCDVTVPFQRRDPVIYLVTWGVLITALLAASLYFGGSWSLNAIFLPKAKGKLVAETASMKPQTLWELPVTTVQRHHFTVKERNIDARLGLSRIEVRRAKPQIRRKRSEKEVQEGVEVTAYDEQGVAVATGTVYESRPKLPVRQKTTDSQRSYRFRYEA